MKKIKDTLVYSPSDLIKFLESPFASWMDRFDLENPGKFKRDGDDKSDKLLQDKGMDHERKVLTALTTEHKTVTTIASSGDFTARHEATIAAMKSGADVVYQAALKKDSFMGYADFLLKVQGKSSLGDYHYEAWDSKLARSTKPYFVIQLLAYSEMLEAIQGVFPASITVVLGTEERKALKTVEFKNYYLSVQRRFLDFQNHFDPNNGPIPKNNEEVRDWSDHAAKIIFERDDLSQVAGIKSSQTKKLETAGIKTLTELATTKEDKIPELEKSTFEKLKRQARLQAASKGLTCPKYEVLNHPEGERMGFRTLPLPSVSDVYFDMEGYPLFDEHGLEYLFGAIYCDSGNEQFIDFWAHDRVQEKKAFEGWIDWVFARYQSDPKMHIYHYASYEVTAMRRLSTQHATREAQVDDLLRGEVFIDLYKIVTQSLTVGEPSYSIKYIEHLYDQKRGGEVTNAGASIVQYARYLDKPDGADYKTSPILKEIRDYNEIDCISTLKLCDWLRNVQRVSKLDYLAKPKLVEEEVERADSPATLLAQTLLAELDGKTALTPDETVQKLLAELLEFHRREAKQYWWKYFEWLTLTHEELVDDKECIGNIRRTKTPAVPDKKSLIAEYSFDISQDTKFSSGSDCQVYVDYGKVFGATIFDLDNEKGLIFLRSSQKKLDEIGEFPEIASILPAKPIATKVITESIFAIVSRFKETKHRDTLPKSIADLLYRTPPQIEEHTVGAPLISDATELLPETVDLIKRMKGTTICIQGPPGAGKTYTGSRVILALLKDGQRVGVTSNSHKAIENLMEGVLGAAKADNFQVTGFKNGSEAEFLKKTGYKKFETKEIASLSAAANGHILIGGTAWTFSRPEACQDDSKKPREFLDYLFVDEAGQVSLANLVAMSRSTKNLVLMGDQMQLEQPIQGSHPGESGESCLNYLIQGHATIPPELGIFLGATFRMRPSVCKFVSQNFYESRLKSDASTLDYEIKLDPSCKLVTQNEGILFLPVKHDDCSQSSEEEAAVINAVIAELMTSKFSDKEGARNFKPTDILVVAPYNLQVNLLKQTLPVGVAAGSVDKFQGREAPVVILSMCSSTLEASPRGVEFLFNPNRLNVALSRAKCLAIVVGNPALQATGGNSIEKMKLVNLFCGIVNQ